MRGCQAVGSETSCWYLHITAASLEAIYIMNNDMLGSAAGDGDASSSESKEGVDGLRQSGTWLEPSRWLHTECPVMYGITAGGTKNGQYVHACL